MLGCYLVTFRFFRYIQNGMYVDFFFKKLSEIFVKNVFNYTFQFFGEKYIIEYLTKKIISNSIFNSSVYTELTKLGYSFYFIQLLSFFFYILAFISLYI